MTNKLGQLTTKYNAYLPAIVMLLLSLILLFTIGLFSLINWRETRPKLDDARLQLASLTAKVQALNSISAQTTALSADKLLVDSVLPSDASIPVVLDQVQQIAAASGVGLTSLQFASKSEASSTISVQAAAAGPYGSVISFIKNLESSGRLLIINSLHFVTVSTPGAEGVTVTLDLSSPYFNLPTAGAALDVSKLTSPEFVSLINRLQSFRIYTPRGGDTTTGKANPFSQ